MNERIKKLKDQCWVERRWNNDMWIEKHIDLEKFAELIVKECMDIAINASSDTNFITGISEADKRALSIAVEIREHFGVEE